VTNDGHGWQQARAALTAFKLAPRWVSIPSQARVALKQLGAERPTLFLVRPDGHLRQERVWKGKPSLSLLWNESMAARYLPTIESNRRSQSKRRRLSTS
jgi:hypothetical protein